ncbi:iron ABC transporter substrate-binding protein [Haematobacter missouriensis]|uniref:Iron ABC transporter substrate-binding protein n=1 Tax=Haematobacter missouriensis TaxID=366616 RepID=A0ABX3ZVG4_9RHOB|nr:siderophore ABC transporter substrate-binding protein [Haematobacter missouriensis]KFI33758.1 iron ABC transporter substrate-binding protein [Haematobacter missouriensis]OWJ77685.1 iron ABC transporter substrate-binding protein [Haematobacter missouriensis]
MNRFHALLGTAALGLALAGAPVMAEPLTIQHQQGTLELPATPQKVLVLDIVSLDDMDALGVEPAGVIGSNLPPYLRKYADDKYLKIGTLFEPDYEAINAAEGDLAVVGGRSRSKYAEVAALLPTIDMTVTNDAEFVDHVKSNLTTLGALFGKSDRADELNATLDQKVAQLKADAADEGTALILVTNAGKLGAYGPTSRVGWLHTLIGFPTVEKSIDDRFHGGDVVSFEYILEKNPKWLFVIDRDAAVGQSEPGVAARAVLDNEIIHRTDAWKEGRIVYLDPASAYVTSGGYTAFTTLVDQVQAAVSKDRGE